MDRFPYRSVELYIHMAAAVTLFAFGHVMAAASRDLYILCLLGSFGFAVFGIRLIRNSMKEL